MNLSPAWVSVLEAEGWQTVHWSSVGPVNAPDAEIMNWTRRERSVVVTNGYDYVELDGKRYEIRTGVHSISGYSAHADQKDLISFIERMRKKPLLEGIDNRVGLV